LKSVNEILDSKIEVWKNKGIFPETEIPDGEKTRELLNKGIDRWFKLFNRRQLLANSSDLETK
ncbi:unnamed protein product, partial [marine sediment metagenome]